MNSIHNEGLIKFPEDLEGLIEPRFESEEMLTNVTEAVLLREVAEFHNRFDRTERGVTESEYALRGQLKNGDQEIHIQRAANGSITAADQRQKKSVSASV